MKLSEMNGWKTLSLIDEEGVKDYRRRAAAMRFLRHLVEGQQEPQTGIYFWIPLASGWRLESFFDSQFPSSRGLDLDHTTIWKKWASTMLRLDDPAATRSISHCYSGLPRGCVTKGIMKRGAPAKYLILHGNDSPVRSAAKLIASRFNLPSDSWVFEYDDHERMLRDDVKTIQRFLGRDLGLLPKAVKF
jgi:hypothetical protein